MLSSPAPLSTPCADDHLYDIFRNQSMGATREHFNLFLRFLHEIFHLKVPKVGGMEEPQNVPLFLVFEEKNTVIYSLKNLRYKRCPPPGGLGSLESGRPIMFRLCFTPTSALS